jgi:hypothetical protein
MAKDNQNAPSIEPVTAATASETKPQPKTVATAPVPNPDVKAWDITVGGETKRVVGARDAEEAWAMYNDSRKSMKTIKQDNPKIELVK